MGMILKTKKKLAACQIEFGKTSVISLFSKLYVSTEVLFADYHRFLWVLLLRALQEKTKIKEKVSESKFAGRRRRTENSSTRAEQRPV